MASVVITVRRDGDSPSPRSLATIARAREFADEHGATVYAACALSADDDLDAWVTALAQAGCDRVAVARGESAVTDIDILAAIHAEIAKRLLPMVVLVPSDGATALAEAIGKRLELRVGKAADRLGAPPTDAVVVPITAEAAGPLHRADDVDVLFYEVDADPVPADAAAIAIGPAPA